MTLGGMALAVGILVDAMVLLSVFGVVAAVWLANRYALIWRTHYAFNRQLERMRKVYGSVLVWALAHRKSTVAGFAVMVLGSLALAPFIGRDFFPTVDAGQIRLHVRAPAGTRIGQTERYFAAVQDIIRETIPASEVEVMLDNMGIPNSGINLSISDGSVMSPADGEILVALTEAHGPTDAYVRQIRAKVREQLPDLLLWAAPADIATQVLNFGLPASIDVQVAGPARNAAANRALSEKRAREIAAVPGVVDARPHQVTRARPPRERRSHARR